MLNSRKRAIAVSAALAMVLVVAGCGSSSKTSTAPNTAEQIKNDKALARHAVLKLKDLPTGYKGTPHTDDSDSDAPEAVLRKFAACAKISSAEADRLLNGSGDDASKPSVDSPDFELLDKSTGFFTRFENTVEIDRSSDDISKPLETFGKEDVLPCWRDVIKSSLTLGLDPGESVTGIKVAALDLGDVGDDAVAFAVRANFKGPARTVPAYINLYYVGSARAGISLTATGIGKPIDKDLAVSLVKTVADRLEGTT
jgi:hypothetical protein